MIISGGIKFSGGGIIIRAPAAIPLVGLNPYTITYITTTSTNYTVVDASFAVTPLLLNGETATPNWISDASTLTNAITTAGNVVSNRFSPIWPTGYYSNQFDGSTGYLSTPANAAFAFGTGDYTVEAWLYSTASAASGTFFGGTSSGVPVFNINALASVSVNPYGAGGTTQSYSFSLNTWYHVAITRASLTTRMFVNGVQIGSNATDSYNYVNTSIMNVGATSSASQYFPGYISNLRVIKGTALYTSNFAPSTQPLTATTQTSLLTCVGPAFTDYSSNGFALTVAGTVKVQSQQPFGPLPASVVNYGSGLFDGSTGYLNLPSSTSVNIGSNNFTFECWIYPTATNSNAGLLGTIVTGGLQLGYYSNTGIGICSCGITWLIYSSVVPTLNTWNHVVFCRGGTGSNQASVFLNGVRVANGTVSTNFVSGAGWIGATGAAPTYYFPGYISNARLVNGNDIYGYSNTSITIPTQPLTAVAGTTLLTLQNRQSHNNNVFQDDSPNNFAITRVGTPTQGSFSPFGVEGWSNYFDGSSGYLSAPYSTLFDLVNGPLTAEVWLYPTAFSNYRPIFAKSNITTGSNDWELLLNSTGNLVLRYWTGSSQGVTSSSALVLNVWSHVALIYNSTSSIFYIYINGIQSGSTSYVATVGTTAGVPFLIGGSNNGIEGTTAVYYSGYMSNIRVSRAVLYSSSFTPSVVSLTTATGTTGTVALLTAQSNRFVDNSTFSNTLTVSGSVSVQPISPFLSTATYSTSLVSGSMYFNGSTDYLSITNSASLNPGTGNFTLECWFYMPTLPTNASIYRGNANGVELYLDGSNKLNVGYAGVSGLLTDPTALLPNQWYHAAVVRSGSILSLYKNGIAVTSATNSTNFVASTANLVGNNAGVYYFNGYIADLRMVIGAALYTTNFTPPTAPPQPVAYVTSSTTASTSLLLLGTNAGVVDQTGRNNLITTGVGIANSSTSVKYGTGSIYFNSAVSSYITWPLNVAEQTLAGNFTIEFWVNPITASGIVGLIGQRASENNYTPILFEFSGAALLFYASTSGSAWAVNGLSSGSLPTNAWTHIAIVRNGTTVTYFVNGVAGGTTGTATGPLMTPVAPLYIGKDSASPSAAGYFNGYIDDLRITNGTARYTTNFTPPSQALPTLGQTGTTVVTTTTVYSITGTYLIVAGGGGGGLAGGGAGGVLAGITTLTSGSSYTIAVGAGGTAGTNTATNGAASTLTIGGTVITAIGGGHGGLNTNGGATVGGSGGGGATYSAGGPYPGAAGTCGQGYPGGSGVGVAGVGSFEGAGGGAGGPGVNAIASSSSGAGGTGTTTTIISTTTAIALGIGQYITATNAVYFAGGGSGGGSGTLFAGGYGGGGAGKVAAIGGSGLAYTGGGGGGGTISCNATGGAGGSGVVIVAYPSSTQLATGGTVTTSTIAGTAYFQHIFTASGTLVMTPPITYSASYLIVAGGGGGGGNYAGGGGAGGLLSGATRLTSGVSYSITVGTGGAGGGTNSGGASGTNSVAFGLTAIGGGGGSICAVAGLPGGSGGGAGGDGNATGGLGTPGQGYSGGTTTGYHPGGGGGGGAGGPGANVCGTSNAGNGGTGTTTTLISTTTAIALGVGQYITATNAVYFAGGGGGGGYNYYSSLAGVGGFGGGGNGAASGSGPSNVGLPALPYTGGGGGGGGGSYGPGGAGGSGVVLISVPTAAWAGTYTGTATVITTVGTSTVLIFKASGTFTA